jgi:ubiquitin C-terminal hydrolase
MEMDELGSGGAAVRGTEEADEVSPTDVPDVPEPIPIPASRALPSFSTRNVIDYTSGLTPPSANAGPSSRGLTTPLSPSSSMGIGDLGSPMALNSPLSRSFGPVPIWADDKVTYKASKERGLSGLSNLGNTCFMNSALQCLCHTPQLMFAFLSGEYKDDLNTDNPLGLGGKLASAFGGLLSKLWKPGASFVTPKHFKFMLSKFAPQFSGYLQQDSQELLSFLLDGLHEDLNRIKEKPYKEEKDADGRPDEEVAMEAWDNYRARNDSVVVDTFQGLYKSTLKCPECGYTSVKFDPFMYLSLPLPSPKRRTLQLTVVDQFCGGKSLLLAVRIPKESAIGDLVREVSKIYEEELARASGPPGGAAASGSDARASEWAIGQWNGKTMDLFLNEGASVESIPEKPNFVYSYFSSKSYKLYAYRYPTGGGRVVTPSAASRAVLVYHKSSDPKVEYSIPSLFFLPKEGYQELQVAKSDDDNLWEVEPDASIAYALEMLVSKAPVRERASDSQIFAQEDATTGTEDATGGDTRMAVDSRSPSSSDSPTCRLMYGTPSGHPKSSSYFSSSQPSIGPADDPSPVYLCAKWENDEGRDVSVVNEPATEHSSVKFLDQQARLPFKATLEDCLECFCQPEQLEESDTWYCNKCKDHVRAVKKLDLWHLPPVLVIHLKRFSYSRFSRDKLDTHIEFPLQRLDLSGFISRSAHATSKKMKLSNTEDRSSLKQEQDPVYDLYAVSNHFGGMGGGHYTAFCQVPDEQGWYDFDDSHVSEVDEDKIQSPAAYVLFYHRRGSDVGLATRALEVADSVHHDLEAKACDSPRGAPLSPRPFSRPLEAIPSSELLDMDM